MRRTINITVNPEEREGGKSDITDSLGSKSCDKGYKNIYEIHVSQMNLVWKC
jgi:hypothetical protein